MSQETVVPPVLYVPVSLDDSGTSTAVTLPMGQGKRALIAYTALDRLAKGCGEGQGWTMVFTSTLSKVREESPFDAVAFDVDFPQGLEQALEP